MASPVQSPSRISSKEEARKLYKDTPEKDRPQLIGGLNLAGAPTDMVKAGKSEGAMHSRYAELVKERKAAGQTLNADPLDPLHFYDHRRGFDADGLDSKDPGGHGSSKFKLLGHPNRFVKDEETGTLMDSISWTPAKNEDVLANYLQEFSVADREEKKRLKRESADAELDAMIEKRLNPSKEDKLGDSDLDALIDKRLKKPAGGETLADPNMPGMGPRFTPGIKTEKGKDRSPPPTPEKPTGPVRPTVRARPVSPGELLQEVLTGAMRGFAEVPATSLEGIAVAAYHLNRLTGWEVSQDAPGKVKPLDDFATKKAADFIMGAIDRYLPEDETLRDRKIVKLSKALGQMGMWVLGGAITQSAYRFPMTTGALMGLSEGQQEYDVSTAAEWKKTLGVFTDGVMGFSEGIPIGNLLNRWDKWSGGALRKVLFETTKQGFEEALQEWGQTIGSNAVANYLFENERPWWDASLEGAEIGGASGAIMGFIASLAGVKHRRRMRKEHPGIAALDAAPDTAQWTPDQPVPGVEDPNLLQANLDLIALQEQSEPGEAMDQLEATEAMVRGRMQHLAAEQQKAVDVGLEAVRKKQEAREAEFQKVQAEALAKAKKELRDLEDEEAGPGPPVEEADTELADLESGEDRQKAWDRHVEAQKAEERERALPPATGEESAEPTAPPPAAPPTEPGPSPAFPNSGGELVVGNRPMKEGQPFKAKLYHGSGAKVERPENALGEGRYSALTREDAEQYGEVEEVEVELDNPAVIRSDADLLEWAKRGGSKEVGVPYDNEARVPFLRAARKAMEDRFGHDGAVVIVEQNRDASSVTGKSFKRLREIFDHSQVVRFDGFDTNIELADQQEKESREPDEEGIPRGYASKTDWWRKGYVYQPPVAGVMSRKYKGKAIQKPAYNNERGSIEFREGQEQRVEDDRREEPRSPLTKAGMPAARKLSLEELQKWHTEQAALGDQPVAAEDYSAWSDGIDRLEMIIRQEHGLIGDSKSGWEPAPETVNKGLVDQDQGRFLDGSSRLGRQQVGKTTQGMVETMDLDQKKKRRWLWNKEKKAWVNAGDALTWQGAKSIAEYEAAVDEEIAAQTEEEGPAESPVYDTEGVVRVDSQDLQLDPGRFQYKMNVDAKGRVVGHRLASTKEWKEEYAGVIQIWQDPADGKYYVVNGHQRVNLANNLGGKPMNALIIDANTAGEARMVGALTNIAEGSGTAIDAANFFREQDAEQLEPEMLADEGLNISDRKIADALGLAELEDFLFGAVARGEFPQERGVIIGQKVPRGLQQQLVARIQKEEKKRKLTNQDVSNLADKLVGAPTGEKVTKNLFGATTELDSLAPEIARVESAIQKRLGMRKAKLGQAAKADVAAILEEAGSQIDREKSAGMSQQAAENLAVFNKLKDLGSPVNFAVTQAAKAIKRGENAETVIKELYDKIPALVEESLQGPGAGPAGGGTQQGGQTSLFEVRIDSFGKEELTDEGVPSNVSERFRRAREDARQASFDFTAAPAEQQDTPPDRVRHPGLDARVRNVANGLKTELILKGVQLEGRRVNDIYELAIIAQLLRDPRYEVFRVVYVKEGRIVRVDPITARLPHTVNTQTDEDDAWGMTPPQRYAARAEHLGADAVYLMHNHPSGRHEASDQDKRLHAQTFYEMGDIVKGHIVTDHGKATILKTRIRGEQVIVSDEEVSIPEMARTPDPLISPKRHHRALYRQVNTETKLVELMGQMSVDSDTLVLVYMNTQYEIRGIDEIPASMLSDPNFDDWLRDRMVYEFGSPQIFLHSPRIMQGETLTRVGELYVGQFLEDYTFVNDANQITSARMQGIPRHPRFKMGLHRSQLENRKWRAEEKRKDYDDIIEYLEEFVIPEPVWSIIEQSKDQDAPYAQFVAKVIKGYLARGQRPEIRMNTYVRKRLHTVSEERSLVDLESQENKKSAEVETYKKGVRQLRDAYDRYTGKHPEDKMIRAYWAKRVETTRRELKKAEGELAELRKQIKQYRAYIRSKNIVMEEGPGYGAPGETGYKGKVIDPKKIREKLGRLRAEGLTRIGNSSKASSKNPNPMTRGHFAALPMAKKLEHIEKHLENINNYNHLREFLKWTNYANWGDGTAIATIAKMVMDHAQKHDYNVPPSDYTKVLQQAYNTLKRKPKDVMYTRVRGVRYWMQEFGLGAYTLLKDSLIAMNKDVAKMTRRVQAAFGQEIVAQDPTVWNRMQRWKKKGSAPLLKRRAGRASRHLVYLWMTGQMNAYELPDQLQSVVHDLRNLLDEMHMLAQMYGLMTPEQYWQDYLPRIRKYGTVDAAFPEWKGLDDKAPMGWKWWAEMHRTGELTPHETDPAILMAAYVRGLYRRIHLSPVVEKIGFAANYAVDQGLMSKEDRGTFTDYLNHIMGKSTKSQVYWTNAIKKQLRKFRHLPGIEAAATKLDIDLDAANVNHLTYALATTIYTLSLARPISGIKNITQQLHTIELVGTKWLAKGYAFTKSTRGKELIVKSGILAEFVPLLEEAGSVSPGRVLQGMQKSLFLFQLADTINRCVTYGAAHEKFMHLAKGLSQVEGLQEDEAGPKSSLVADQLKGNRKIGDLLMDMRLDERNAVIRALRKGDIAEAANQFARAMVYETQYAYGMADSPVAWSNPVWRMLSIFHTWPMYYAELQLKEVASATRAFRPSAYKKNYIGLPAPRDLVRGQILNIKEPQLRKAYRSLGKLGSWMVGASMMSVLITETLDVDAEEWFWSQLGPFSIPFGALSTSTPFFSGKVPQTIGTGYDFMRHYWGDDLWKSAQVRRNMAYEMDFWFGGYLLNNLMRAGGIDPSYMIGLRDKPRPGSLREATLGPRKSEKEKRRRGPRGRLIREQPGREKLIRPRGR